MAKYHGDPPHVNRHYKDNDTFEGHEGDDGVTDGYYSTTVNDEYDYGDEYEKYADEIKGCVSKLTISL